MTPSGGVERYDAIIIGAGQAGGPLARAFAGAGRKTALIEREHVGGTCVNEGCTPTKTMIASGRVAYLARRGADYGVQTGDIAIDMAKVRAAQAGDRRELSQRRRAAHLQPVRRPRSDRRRGTIRRCDDRGGHAHGRRRCGTLASDLIFINAGARPAELDIEGLSVGHGLQLDLDHGAGCRSRRT